MNFRKSHQSSRNFDELLEINKVKYTREGGQGWGVSLIRVKNVLPEIISSNQNVKNYVHVKQVEMREMREVLNKQDFLVTVNIEKTFGSVNHLFFIGILGKTDFANEFIKWVKILLNYQESCL